MSALALLQTIPSLALLGFCITLFQIIGGPAAIVAAVVYSLFPIVLNTYTGITEVDPRLKDAARGMGMTDLQVLYKVELPMALPVIMAGIRTGAVYAIGMITICAIVGANGLGIFITTGISRGDVGLTLLGVIPILILTMLFFWGMSALAQLSQKRYNLGLVLAGGLVVFMAGYALAVPTTDILAKVVSPSEVSEDEEGVELYQRSLAETWEDRKDFWRQTFLFLSLTLRGLGLALLFGLPLGILLTRIPQFASPLITVLALVQTIPSLALLGFFATLFALFGPSAAIFATVVYSLFPVVLNTYTGIRQVNPRTIDAAKGMGMTNSQILLRVELPLAFPIIMAGVRTAAMYAIAMVTIGAMVGAKGLGGFILEGMANQDDGLILLGVIPILALSLLVFWSLGSLTWLNQIDPALGQRIGAGLIVCLSLFALVEPVIRPRADVRIGSKNFTENNILGEILKLMLEHHTDLTVEIFPNLGSNYAFKSLNSGQIDVYPEYTGTLLTATDALNMNLKEARKLKPVYAESLNKPVEKVDLIDIVRGEVKKEFGLVLLKPFGLNNTYVVAVPEEEMAEKYDIKTISELRDAVVKLRKKKEESEDPAARKIPDFQINVDQEFLERPDGWKGLSETYNLPFTPGKDVKQFDPNFMYRDLKNNPEGTIVIGFATQWQIPANDLVILEDNKGYFPSYHAAPLVRQGILDKYPQIKPILNKLAGVIDDQTMQKLNYQAAVRKIPARKVARDFLENHPELLKKEENSSKVEADLGR